MKKVIAVATLFILFSIPVFSQNLLDKFNDKDEVTAVVVNKKMFELMSKVKVDANDKETQQYMNLIKKLDNLKVYTTTNAKVANDMKQTADKYIKTVGLEELMKVNEGGKNIRIVVKSGAPNAQIKEMLMFIDGNNRDEETVLMSLTGSFYLNEIAVLTDKMKIPGREEFKKATK
ncbi:DUF4252 domain-containing protein [Flavobacterium sp. UMI-01]|uniref:DUF4252 domain-containing protein n=1 Tax=Flavobacterium sp. UMI-01 TaxID=1441053 RepID=UPI001C7CFD87|nr:DUF4252 domain-containing protein [Flavobacterium sp. UMI-01]GIZ07673.1 hypothetical protein FUMI01_04000 [Flavobacterium sp. UMI-01]